MNTITVQRIERQQDGEWWWILCTRSNGSTFFAGERMTERGSKQMLTRRAKQFGLTVSGNVAN